MPTDTAQKPANTPAPASAPAPAKGLKRDAVQEDFTEIKRGRNDEFAELWGPEVEELINDPKLKGKVIGYNDQPTNTANKLNSRYGDVIRAKMRNVDTKTGKARLEIKVL